MSGLEVGFGVLGILPLIVSAAEHYSDCFRPFSRYRKFSAEIDRFQRQLKVQKTIFRHHCLILLENVTLHDAAASMLGDRNHPLWADQEIERQLARYLEDLKETCIETIELIQERLQEVEKKSQGFGVVLKDEQEKPSIGGKAWRHLVAEKIKFSFSKSQLDEDLVALRSLNDDFRILTSQTGASTTENQGSRRAPRQLNKDIERCQAIRLVSQQVYNALGRACTKHTEHLAHFNLHVEQKEEIQSGHNSQIKFKIAFSHVSLVGSGSGDPLWFMVDSILHGSGDSGSTQDTDELDLLGISLKRGFQPQTSCAPKSSAKRVRFQRQLPATLPTLSPRDALPSNDLLSPPIMRRDFCDHLRRYNCKTRTKENTCIGMLEATEMCKHLVYPLPPMFDGTDKHGLSLEGFLTSMSSKKEPFVFPHYERLCLAKNLALAVLQYYATPWLKIAWRSQDIVFFREQKESLIASAPNLSAPHLNVRVIGADGQNTDGMQHSRNLAPNPILFGLGVVLLEIAYSAPLKSLQKPCDLENGIQNQFSEFFTARRLASSIGREMGSSYGTIVKKLLQCDFGCGDDFSSHDLQAGYYRDVICELGRLEQGFRDLQIG
ncbi:MAG: hypothetical protein Q9191_008059 [Dirinaria sp. TL-2023a]